jgi:hypothetical protein
VNRRSENRGPDRHEGKENSKEASMGIESVGLFSAFSYAIVLVVVLR